MKQFALGLGLLLTAVVTAEAKPARKAEAVLVAAPATASETIIDGRVWKCLGTGCLGRAAGTPASQSAARECHRVAAKFGELALYRTDGRVFTATELAVCNTAAAKRPTDTALAGAR